MRPLRALPSLCAAVTLLTTFTFAVQPDRITGAIDSGRVTSLKGNIHGMARRQFDLGRVDRNQVMSGVSLVFRPSPAQQADLDKLLKEQQARTSPNYHKWLTPAQFADRFGMSRNDIQKVTAWLESEGFSVTRVANSRNQVFFEGTVAQIEAAFHTEIHNYVVGGKVHFANATEPALPAVLAGMTIGLQNLHNFQPRPRPGASVAPGAKPHFTSHSSGNHFLTPDDFATIYDVQAYYTPNGFDGTGQTIAVIGQSDVSFTDLHNFRTAAGLAANDPVRVLVPGSGVSTKCSGDEGESDLDLEWTAGIAKNATVFFVYAGPGPSKTCATRNFGAFDALQYAIDQTVMPVIPIISNSYGNCEANIGSAGAQTMQGWAQQANSQGQTIFSASGDSGAADCDFQVQVATQGLAVDLPAAVPEVTAVGGTEFSADTPTCITPCPPGGDPPYWAAAGTTTDTLSSALQYIPETSWNDSIADINAGGTISASGGGASIFFDKPYWQAVGGMPLDTVRDVPDIALSGSADHDGYLFCSEDSSSNQSCSAGFRDADGNLTVVGGTSAGAPTMAGIMALFNQAQGATNGWGNLNLLLYELASTYGTSFNDITTGDNVVPCASATPDCSGGLLGFTAGAGYDQVTGIGSVNAFQLALDTQEPDFDFIPSVSTVSIVQGATATIDFTIFSANGFAGTLNFSSTSCTNLPSETTCSFSPASVNITNGGQGTVTLSVKTTAPTAKLVRPLDRSSGTFYAMLLPGILGICALGAPRNSRKKIVRVMALVVVLASSVVWMGACGGSGGGGGGGGNPGTPVGTYNIVVTATTGGPAPITTNASIVLNVN